MKREELEEIPMIGWECYDKEKADSVMDEMEKQIRTLENDKEEMYEANLVLQARIKELEKDNKDLRHNLEDWKAENEALKQRIKELEAAISKMETTQKWISVKDRKPPKGQHVLIARNHRSLYPIDVVCWIEDYITHDIVTHWMPLPPPPTTEEKQ